MTPSEFKTVLASKENKLAEKAIQIIKEGRPLDELKAVVEAGAANAFYERCPRKPRSAFLTHHVLDTCFESKMGIVSQDANSAVIGHVHNSTGREEYFRFLLSTGQFTQGTNNGRGSLFRHILSSCFYGEHQENARKFAKILIETGVEDINFFAANDYAWTNHPDQLAALIELGCDPKADGVIDCALNYLGCSPTGRHTTEDRINVLRKLLEAGAVPTKNLDRAISWQGIRHQLETSGLLDTMVEFGIISAAAPDGYQRWIDFFVTKSPQHQPA